jgi:lipopolysaccharide transport system permease protein
MSRTAANAIFRTHESESILAYLNPVRPFVQMWRQRGLLSAFTRREIEGRYKGSHLGLVWALINPLMMLAVYTFVFHGVFKNRWNASDPNENFMVYAMHMFARIIAFNVFAESVNRAPTLITTNPNYVKKVVFPLEILPVSLIGSALFHSLLSLGVMLISALFGAGTLHLSWLYLPICYVPLVLLTAGVCWFLASLGVFLRDIGNFISVLTTLLFFLTPITYREEWVPKWAITVFHLNPLASIVSNFGRAVNDAQPPDWPSLAIVTVVGLATAVCGYAWFMLIKRAFADVI